jgi:hypothetical protein
VGALVTGAELQAYTKHLLFEEAATTALATPTNLGLTVSIANQKVWHEAVKANQSFFTERAELTCYADPGYVDLLTINPDGVYLFTNVLLKDGDDWIPLDPVVPQDGHIFGAGSRPAGYYLEGDRLYLAPTQSGDAELRISYIPELGALVDASPALGGKLATYHPLVAYEAALVLAVKDEARADGWKFVRDELLGQMKKHLARRQTQRPRSIRAIPYV